MPTAITKFQIWVLKRIAKRIVLQSQYHQDNITIYYKIMADAAQKEFREDNRPTLHGFLTECHEDALKRSWS